MKLKFWQKAYIFTLAIFLLCLNSGILAIAAYANSQNEKNAVASTQIQIDYIARSFAVDCEELYDENYEAEELLLMNAYGNHYRQNNIYLAFSKNGELSYSAIPSLDENNRGSKNQNSYYASADGKRHLVIEQSIDGSNVKMTVAKDVSALDTSFAAITATCVGTGFVISVLLAVCLYFILKKLFITKNRNKILSLKLF
jgi:hypothetical protein